MKHKLNQSRQGVTLLFVVSMIVLFLLMGTTFMVVSNSFTRAAKIRRQITTNRIESLGENAGERFVEKAFLDLVRGPDLNDENSPLRGHSILADMYGYGFAAYVKDVEDELIETPGGGASNNPQFIRLTLIGQNNNTFDDTTTLDGFSENIDGIDIDGTDVPIDNINPIGNDMLTGEPIYGGLPLVLDVASSTRSKFDVMPSTPGRFNGQLLSFVSGEVNGVTCRIIDHQVFPFEDTSYVNDIRYEHRFVVMMLNPPSGIKNGELDQNNSVNDLIVAYDDVIADNEDDRFPTRVVINGRPFVGTGLGFFTPDPGAALAAVSDNLPGGSSTTINWDQSGMSREDMIFNGFMTRQTSASDGTQNINDANSYAPNEPFDIPGIQNQFLAGSNRLSPGVVGGSTTPETRMSFEDFNARPGLGVDNNSDNIDDGVWVDFGASAYTDSNGNLVKPLASFLVVDLDSKINVNFHGNRSQISYSGNSRFASSFNVLEPVGTGFDFANNMASGLGIGPAETLLGSVFSDVVTPVSDPDGVERAEFARLMIGDIDANNNIRIVGRYGTDSSDRRLNAGGGPVPGLGVVTAVGGNDELGQDLFSAYKLFGYPFTANNGEDDGGLVGGFFRSSPMDIYGRLRFGYPVPTSGYSTSLPIHDIDNSTISHAELINNPYEVNLLQISRSNSPDAHFTLRELEAVYRQDDRDITGNSLNRLLELAPSLADGNQFNFTTDSWEVPTQIMQYVSDGTSADSGRLENLMGKLYRVLNDPDPANHTNNFGIGALPADPSASDYIDRERRLWREISGFEFNLSGTNPDGTFALNNSQFLVAPELRAGRLFNLNRPFGNGIDDDGDGIVDEPGEGLGGASYYDALGHPDSGITELAFDHNNDSDFPGNLDDARDSALEARQAFARQLYILTLLTVELVDRNGNGSVVDNGIAGDFPVDFNGDGGVTPDDRVEFRKTVAQWAINVVDFRDPDSIMTPFEVDLQPFDGWDVDGDIATAGGGANRWVVFGAERPELLLTESLVMHDRRTENLDTAGGSDDFHDSGDPTRDEDFDSRLVPQASAFFELYRPWNAVDVAENEISPSVFDTSGNGSVDLTQLAPASSGSNDEAPVWRITVLNSQVFSNQISGSSFGGGFDPTNDPDTINNPLDLSEGAVRRRIYFATPGNDLTDPTTGNEEFGGQSNNVANKVYVPETGLGVREVVPGGYAVVGSAGQNISGDYTTVLGRRTDYVYGSTINISDNRRIELDSNNNQVRIFGSSDPSNASIINDATVLPIVSIQNSDVSLGITDPAGGYSNVTGVVSIDPNPDGEGFIFTDGVDNNAATPFDEPVDRISEPEFYDQVLRDDHITGVGPNAELATQGSIFVVLLQRLADPTQPWDGITNRYITIDSIGSDLVCFNGIDTSDEMPHNISTALVEDGAPMWFGSFERRSDQDESTRGQSTSDNRFRMLWKTELSGLNAQSDSPDAAASVHVFPKDLQNSLGGLNDSYSTNPGNHPFPWLRWNNRPFASPYEITEVPFTSSYQLTRRMDVSLVDSLDMVASPYDALPVTTGTPSDDEATIGFLPYSGEFPHLFNFHRDDAGAAWFHRLFDYVETPSLYVGTEIYLNPENYDGAGNHQITRSFAPPFDYISNFRIPGKININTVSDENTWNALMGAYSTQVTRDNWRSSVNGDAFAPASSSSFTSSASDPDSMEASLFRAVGTNPLFDFAPAMDTNSHVARSPFYKYHMRNRLGNLVTNRSSVFAIWITIGYFEMEDADGDGVFTPEGAVEDEFGNELVNRGFFVFDRSIPVAFEPGKNHNIQRAIRVSSFIE